MPGGHDKLSLEVQNFFRYLAGDAFGSSRGLIARTAGEYSPSALAKIALSPDPKDKPTYTALNTTGLYTFLAKYLPFLELSFLPSRVSVESQLPYMLTTVSGFTVIFWFCFPTNPNSHQLDQFMSFIFLPFLLPLYFYGTILPPFPDLVFNLPPLAKVQGEVHNHGLLPKIRTHLPYEERYHSAIYENRLKLIAKTILFRCIENVILVVVLPHSTIVCEWTGWCDAGASYAENMADARVYSGYVYVGLMFSVVVVTCSVLLVQAIALNRLQLAAVAKVTGQWEFVTNFDGVTQAEINAMLPWDGKKTYKEGDYIKEMNEAASGKKAATYGVFKCLSDRPTARPSDVFLRAASDLFQKDVGPLASSSGFGTVSKLHMVHCLSVLAVTVGAALLGYRYTASGLAFGANVVAAAAISRVLERDLGHETDRMQQVVDKHRNPHLDRNR